MGQTNQIGKSANLFVLVSLQNEALVLILKVFLKIKKKIQIKHVAQCLVRSERFRREVCRQCEDLGSGWRWEGRDYCQGPSGKQILRACVGSS